MTYQKKSYKKFVATAASATLVASAIVPVVSAASFPDVEEKHEFATYINAAVDAGLAASIFHFGEVQIPELKKVLKENNINVRL